MGDDAAERCEHGHTLEELCAVMERWVSRETQAFHPPEHEDVVLAAPLSLSLSIAALAAQDGDEDEAAAHLWAQDVDGRTVSGTIELGDLVKLAEAMAATIQTLVALRAPAPDDASSLDES